MNQEIESLKKKIEDYRYLCEFDKIPKLLVDNPGLLRQMKITPASELTGKEKEWADEVIRKYESGENRVVSRDEEVANLNAIIDLKEKERREWADMCITKQRQIEYLTNEVKILTKAAQNQPKL